MSTVVSSDSLQKIEMKELFAIHGYIRRHYQTEHVILNEIIKIIHQFCVPIIGSIARQEHDGSFDPIHTAFDKGSFPQYQATNSIKLILDDTQSCKSMVICKSIIYGFVHEFQQQWIIPDSIINLCFIFYHQYLLELTDIADANPFMLLSAIYHLHLPLKWKGIAIKVQCENLQDNNIDTELKQQCVAKQMAEDYTSIFISIYNRILMMLSSFYRDNELLSVSTNVHEWSQHDLLISLIHHIIHHEPAMRTRCKTWQFVEYIRRYFQQNKYNGSSFTSSTLNVTKSDKRINKKDNKNASISISNKNSTSSTHHKDSGYSHHDIKKKTIYLDINGQVPNTEEPEEEKEHRHNDNNQDDAPIINAVPHKIEQEITSTETINEKKQEIELEIFERRDLTKEEISKLEKETLLFNGYERTSFIATCLQGEVFRGKMMKNKDRIQKGTDVVIKKVSKKLHKLGITITKTGKKIKIKENIVAEAQLMQSFMNNSPPTSLIKYYDFFEDTDYYYLVMENGGLDYFDFVVKCHELIKTDKLSLSEWRKHSKFMFAQMMQFFRWMHNAMHCCHLNICLENILIDDGACFDEESKTLKRCYIKFIDFSLTESFNLKTNPLFLCNKDVGILTHYKAPKVYAKKEAFYANKADVWSLGVCLFMMIIGAPPYNKPIDEDATFQYIKHQQIAKLLQEWGRIKYITVNLHDLLTRMLCFDEDERITLDEIVRHPWITHYFPNDNVGRLVNGDGESKFNFDGDEMMRKICNEYKIDLHEFDKILMAACINRWADVLQKKLCFV